MQEYRKAGEGGKATVAMKVAAGGIITPERLNAMYPDHDEMCRCGHLLPNEEHLYWICRLLQEDARPEVAATNWMTRKATEELGLEASLSRVATEKWAATPLKTMWLRGLVPKAAWPLPEPEDHYQWLPGSWERPRFRGTVCTDGSGGFWSANAKLRRCGWAAVMLDSSGNPRHWKWIAAALGGSVQTVPRAEIYAVLMVVEHAEGDCHVWSDHENIIKTINERRWSKARSGTNSDLWNRLEDALSNSVWTFRFSWVNSHVKDGMDVQTKVPRCVYLGNKKADSKAGLAAETNRIPDADVENHKTAMGQAKEILMRLTTIADDMYKERSHTKLRRMAGHRITLTEKWDAAKAVTQHHIVDLPGGGMHCCICLSRAAPAKVQQLKWLQEGCRTSLNKPHLSHKLSTRGHVVWCSDCGYWSSSRYRALGEPCPGRPQSGLQAMCLRQVKQGLPPP